MTTIFKVCTEEEVGENWLIASMGEDEDGHSYYVTTDCIPASELWRHSDGARADAEKVCRLLNEEEMS